MIANKKGAELAPELKVSFERRVFRGKAFHAISFSFLLNDSQIMDYNHNKLAQANI